MAEQIESPTATQAHRIFDGSYCDGISYDIRVKTTEVNLEAFLAVAKWQSKEFGFSHCAPKHTKTDYHLHVSWRVRKGTFAIEIEFVKGGIPPDKDESEPFAEDFIEWVEKFFILKKTHVRIDADFEYPADLRQSSYPLPAGVPIGPNKTLAEIDGISFGLPDRPEGITKVWMTQRPKKLFVHVLAEKEIEIQRIEPRADMTVISAVLDSMLEPKQEPELRNKKENKQ